MNQKRRNIFIVLICCAAVVYFLYPKAKPQVSEDVQVTQDKSAEVTSEPVAQTQAEKIKPQPVAVDKAAQSKSTEGVKEKLLSKEEITRLRQETKAGLASAYTAMAAYRAEYDRYTTDFQVAGWMPSGNAELKYKIGFLEAFLPNRANKELSYSEQPERTGTDSFISMPVYNDDPEGPKYSYSESAKEVNLADFRKYCRMNCTASESEFEVLAVIPLGGNRYDVWTINNQKVMEQVQDGLQAP